MKKIGCILGLFLTMGFSTFSAQAVFDPFATPPKAGLLHAQSQNVAETSIFTGVLQENLNTNKGIGSHYYFLNTGTDMVPVETQKDLGALVGKNVSIKFEKTANGLSIKEVNLLSNQDGKEVMEDVSYLIGEDIETPESLHSAATGPKTWALTLLGVLILGAFLFGYSQKKKALESK